jgi:hypothetical protein
VTPNQLQEEISKAYLHAVAAKCGYAVGKWEQDHGCVDTTVSAATALGNGTLVESLCASNQPTTTAPSKRIRPVA